MTARIHQSEPFSVLIVDDEPVNIQIAAIMLQHHNIKAAYALSGVEALDRIQTTEFDLFLIDIMMPGMDGIELCRALKKDPHTKDIPVLFLTAIHKRDTIVEAFQAGAADYITKPFFGPELVQRVHANLRVRDLQKRLEASVNETSLQILKGVEVEEELRKSQAQLADANRVLANWAHRDPLTGLWNRRKAWDLMMYEADRNDRHKRVSGILMLDLDYFKVINDTRGHDIGDLVLKRISELITATVRTQDIVVRWGGEEFLIILPETSLDGTRTLAEKLRAVVDTAEWDIEGVNVTLSVGVAQRRPGQSWETAIKSADDALYLAKESGRNRIELSTSHSGHQPEV